MRIHTTGVVAVTGAILLLTFGAAPATAASGGGSVGYCSSMRVNLSTTSGPGAVAHSWSDGTDYSWYNSSTRTRNSTRPIPFAYYGYATGGTLYSLSTGC